MGGKKNGAAKGGHAKKPAPKALRQWRDYRTDAGGRPVRDFILGLTRDEAAAIVAAMREVRKNGITHAKHSRGEIYEVIADTKDKWFRVLFAALGRYSQVLLSLNAFEKKTNKTPPQEIDLAETRLSTWKKRGRELTAAKAKAKTRRKT